MPSQQTDRRLFLKTLAVGVSAALAASSAPAQAAHGGALRVWSCGGLAEAMDPAHAAYTAHSGVNVAYTGAFAAALGKSLLTGGGHADVFAGRVLALARKLRASGKMLHFKPLCFTSYVIVTPRGNPGNIRELADMSRAGVRVAMAQEASPPGGQAVMGVLKAAGLTAKVMPRVTVRGSCVQRVVESVTRGDADAMIVERRISRMGRFAGELDVVEMPEALYPVGPLTFTVGVMADAADRELSSAYVDWITGLQGQDFFEKAGFIPAISEEGKRLTEKLGVRDVA